MAIGGSSSLSTQSLLAGQQLNSLTDSLQSQMYGVDGQAMTEETQGQEMQVESDANNQVAGYEATAAQDKMKTNAKIFQGIDGLLNQ